MNDRVKPRVLLVDDDRDCLEQLVEQFAARGYEVTTAGCEQEARDRLAEGLPDLAVLDLMLDSTDGGFQLAHLIKKLDPDLPVLLVTGVTAAADMVFEPSGPGMKSWIKADAVLAKPIRFEQIERELDRLGVRHD